MKPTSALLLFSLVFFLSSKLVSQDLFSQLIKEGDSLAKIWQYTGALQKYEAARISADKSANWSETL